MYQKVVKRADGIYDAYVYDKKGGTLLNQARGRTKETAIKLAKRIVQPDPEMAELVRRWRHSPEYAKLSKASQIAYDLHMTRFTEAFGHYNVSMFKRLEIKLDLTDWRDEYKEHPRTADYMIVAVGALFKWLLGRGISDAQPTRGISKLYSANRSFIIWTPEDIEQFCSVAPKQLQLVVKLAAHTGMRLADLLNLRWCDIVGKEIRFRTSKKQRWAFPQVTPECQRVLDECMSFPTGRNPSEQDNVLVTLHGTPWTIDGWKTQFSKYKTRANVSKHFHDLRGTAATNYKKAGYRNPEIATIMGWSEETVDTMLRIYVDAASFLESASQRVADGTQTFSESPENGIQTPKSGDTEGTQRDTELLETTP